MTQYDRLMSGKATPEQIEAEIKAKTLNRALYRKFPGHEMVENFLAPNGLDIRDVSRMAKIPARSLHLFIRGEKRVDDYFATKLGEFFRTGKDYWLQLQDKFDKNGTL